MRTFCPFLTDYFRNFYKNSCPLKPNSNWMTFQKFKNPQVKRVKGQTLKGKKWHSQSNTQRNVLPAKWKHHPRDLKPANFLITNGKVSICDLASCWKIREKNTRTRKSSDFITLNYSPPAFHSEDEVGLFSDIYGLGVILRKLSCTGREGGESCDDYQLVCWVWREKICLVVSFPIFPSFFFTAIC